MVLSTTPEDASASPAVSLVPDMVLPTTPEDASTSPAVPLVPGSRSTASPMKTQPTKLAGLGGSTTNLVARNMSAVSLALSEKASVHSGHHYLQEDPPKQPKIKRRPSNASLFSQKSSIGKGKSKNKDESKGNANEKPTWYSRIKRELPWKRRERGSDKVERLPRDHA